jgi:hypothetical protein
MDTTRFTIDEHGTARLQTSKGVLMLDAADLHVMDRGMIKFKKSGKNNSGSWYADMWHQSPIRKRIGSVSRLVMNAPSGMEVDHINHDTLDNRRCNLRICTRSENARNSSKQRRSKAKYKGVMYVSDPKYDGSRSGGVVKRWRAYTRVMGKRIWLGYYATQEGAAAAYNAYAVKTFGAFANPSVLGDDKDTTKYQQQMLAV